MKQSKKLLRKHIDFLKKKGVSREVSESLRFYREERDGTYVFLDKEGKLVAWNKENKCLSEYKLGGGK